ncbi:MAG: RNA methyltransferase [Zoogloeaceae bacterium]|jgi:23S rRNA (adenine2503-C2)-methyltransferase|nr:RNA methyltransferase [Zoogloeaceae bacterium]
MPPVSLSQLRQSLVDQGAKPAHIERILRAWLHALPLESGPANQPVERCFAKSLRLALPECAARLHTLAQVVSEHPAEDGSIRLLLGLADGQRIESVLLPRDGVCVSTQVGCAVGCVFCMTGKSGLLRQLDSSEILAQVVLARQRRSVRRVVFMGMGEPAHNLAHVLEAIETLGTLGGIGHKNLVISSVGDMRLFEALFRQRVRPALALSLHSAHLKTRAALLPKAPVLAPEALVDAGERYARFSGYPIQYQWTLLAGINDSDAELAEIVRLLKGKYAMLNFIPYNATSDALAQGALPLRRPELSRIIHLTRQLNQHGILTRIRHSAGQEIDGGCGQLRARAAAYSDSHNHSFTRSP